MNSASPAQVVSRAPRSGRRDLNGRPCGHGSAHTSSRRKARRVCVAPTNPIWQHASVNTDSALTSALAPFLEFEVNKATGREVSGNWRITPGLHQPTGILHGGIHCVVVEGLASWGATLWYGDRGTVVGVSNTTDFYKPVSEGRLHSVARPISQDLTTQVWGVETRDELERLIANGKLRLMNLPSKVEESIKNVPQ